MTTTRSIIIGFILVILLSAWTIYSEHLVGSINSISPPPGAIFLFFFIVLINSLVKSKRLNLQESELIVLYSLMLVAAPISSFAVTRFFMSILLAPFYFATPENEFETIFHGIIPRWFAPRSPNIVNGFFEPLERGTPWKAWVEPLSIWVGLILVFYVLMLCMSVIVHRHWIDRERLTFPTVYLPTQLARKPEAGSVFNSFLRNKLLWVGFFIPVILHGINGLGFYYPVIPSIPVRGNFSSFLTESPWNAVDTLPINFYPNVVGFTYLLPVEISFSCWFFYLLSKAGMVLGAVLGWRTTTSSGSYFPFPHYQSAGAFIALILANLWFGRRQLGSAFVSAFRISSKTDETDKSLAKLYRFAFIGFVVTLSILVAWFVYVGVKPGVIVTFLVLFIIYSLSAGRIRTEAGLGAIAGPIRMDDLLRAAIGTRRIGLSNLTVLAHLRWITVDLRGFMSSVPAQLEAFKMTGRTPKSLKRITVLIFCSVALALIVSCISLLWVSYRYGTDVGGNVNSWWMISGPRETFDILRYDILNLQGTDWISVGFTSIGIAVTGVMAYLRTRFLWFPFHPIGYAAGFSRMGMDWVWLSVLIGWGLKLSIVKYGGIKLNRTAIPCFLGLVLGDFFMAGFWSIMGNFGEKIAYYIFP